MCAMCYKIELRIFGSKEEEYPSYYSDGYLKTKRDSSFEGFLTNDFIEGKIKDNFLEIKLSFNEWNIYIPFKNEFKENIEIPGRYQVYSDSKCWAEITFLYKVQDYEEIKKIEKTKNVIKKFCS